MLQVIFFMDLSDSSTAISPVTLSIILWWPATWSESPIKRPLAAARMPPLGWTGLSKVVSFLIKLDVGVFACLGPQFLAASTSRQCLPFSWVKGKYVQTAADFKPDTFYGQTRKPQNCRFNFISLHFRFGHKKIVSLYCVHYCVLRALFPWLPWLAESVPWIFHLKFSKETGGNCNCNCNSVGGYCTWVNRKKAKLIKETVTIP